MVPVPGFGRILFSLPAVMALLGSAPGTAFAHADTMDGPVVMAARAALEEGNLDLALIWVRPAEAAELQAAFDMVMAVRDENDEVRELADAYFLETAVRLHREGTGEAFGGISPAGTPTSQAIVAAELSIQSGTLTEMDAILSDQIASGLHDHFTRVMALRDSMDGGVESGRAFAEACLDYIHYVEAVERAATARSSAD